MRHELEIDEYRAWAQEKWVDYASADTESGRRKRLLANLHNKLRVTHGADVVYEGPHVSDAIRAYNDLG